jgi:hypothetical protein
MKNKKLISSFILEALSAVALLCGGGCSTPVDLQGNYSTPTQSITAGFDATTNAITVTGQVSNTNTTAGGSITVGK